MVSSQSRIDNNSSEPKIQISAQSSAFLQNLHGRQQDQFVFPSSATLFLEFQEVDSELLVVVKAEQEQDEKKNSLNL